MEKQTVLVVDDSPINLQIAKALLDERYKVRVAIRGAAALKLARSTSPPKLILLDWEMPEMNGDEVCRQLKAEVETASIPVIFLTGNDDEEMRKQALALGAVGYLTRPLEPEQLLRTIEEALSASQST